ncbi:putative zinc transporter [Trypanosoma theileri]|uniref:Putative zinc transporter n=1 Tax=Trypanosoma theileri TaxID=67003 RepID=A0A1X0NUD3_9TRYP|nr:putative zinc transporter [Trypanosoma theileri]ORC88221.1 putative zinc transporter [Trypanosoma theileri]
MTDIDSTVCPGEARLLLRRNGTAEAMQRFNLNEFEKVKNFIKTLSFAPLHHKTFFVPSVAELYDDDDESYNTDAVNKSNGPTDVAWLDIETDNEADLNKVLSFFPLHSSTKQDVRERKNSTERAEIFPSCGYVCINIAAKQDSTNVIGLEEDETVMVSIIAFDQFLLTIHRKPFKGKEELMAQMESLLSSSTSDSEPVSVFVCSLISSFVKEYQKEPSSILVDVDSVNELVLQIQPSRCDQMDLLRRIEALRHRLSYLQAAFLAKESLLQQLILPVMRRIFIAAEPSVVGRYQRLLSGLLLSIERLRKGRDVLNLSSMSLVGGVSMRLLQHCHWMDFLNNVMTQMSLVTMPICIIPGLFTMNVRVPFEESEGLTAFLGIAAVTALIFAAGMAYPTYVYFRYKPPGALVPPSLS